VDPHAWLDPANARAWVGAIADALVAADPANAERYRANAAAARDRLDALTAEIEAEVAPVRETPFVVFHDAYQYFEHRFDIEAAGAIAISDASDPSAARLSEIRAMLGEIGAACVFAEPQFDDRVVAAVTEGTAARVATLDPVGADIPLGPDFYPTLLRRLAGDLTGCLAAAG
jgi:zinc transport system substrate-binding protein